MVLIRTH